MKYMNEKEIELVTKKLDFYIRENDSYTSSIREIFDQLNYYYESKEVSKLDEIENHLYSKLKQIQKKLQKNKLIIEKALTDYKQTRIEIENKFERIGNNLHE